MCKLFQIRDIRSLSSAKAALFYQGKLGCVMSDFLFLPLLPPPLFLIFLPFRTLEDLAVGYGAS